MDASPMRTIRTPVDRRAVRTRAVESLITSRAAMRVVTISLVILVSTCLGLGTMILAAAPHQHPAPLTPPLSPVVSRVEGLSNFHRLGLLMESSAMGRTDVWGNSPDAPALLPADGSYLEGLSGPMTLTGADLYRFNCQPCHRADGNGVPPEVNAITGPVQATSATMIVNRMKERGRPISASFARELAAGSKKDLLDRLKNGGQKMPPFAYLSDREITALVSYLNVLAGVPGHVKPQTVREPVTRVGELIVKSTCHICHDATGSWPDPGELLQGFVPPIGGFTTEKSMPELISKVRHGAPVVMGVLNMRYRGRMPVFNYLSDSEVASAYLYLMMYPAQRPGRIRRPQN